ncbi:MAG TPA: AI-2E family transporter [Vicinamibacterales bacterium]
MSEAQARRVDVTFATWFRLLAVVALVWIWLRLWQWILIFVVAIFLAVALDPAVRWLDERGLKRRFGGPLVVLALAALIAGFFAISGAQLKQQAGMLGDRISEAREQISDWVPEPVREMLSGASGGAQGAGASQSPGGSGAGTLAAQAVRAVVSGIASILVAFVLTMYLLLDGRRTFEWFVAFAPPPQRPRIKETAEEARIAVIGYMRGNVATSVLAAIVTFIFLISLEVPAALLLALLAGILNFVPVIGLLLSLVPAVLLALTVSPGAAIAVAAFYLGYNAIENYYIQPKVYGHEMQLSSLAVLAAFAAGAELGGVIGALIALPIAAMYPPIESLWLKGRLPANAVEEHRKIEASEEH